MRLRTRILGGAAAFVVIAGGGCYQYYDIGGLASVFTGNAARLLCSAVFDAHRDPDVAWRQELGDRATSPGRYLARARTEIDVERQTVSASLYGWKSRTALYREGVGCTVAEGISLDELRAQGTGTPTSLPPEDPGVLWPEGGATLVDDLPDDVDEAALTAAMDAIFDDPDPDRPIGTRGVVVVRHGRIIAERYAEGFDKDTAQLSNSVAKSVTSTLLGILVGDGVLDIDEPAPIPEWHGEDDPRREITLNDLIQMSGGQEWDEDYTKLDSDITRMYVGNDLSTYAIAKPLESEPGTVWEYSTGTANILGRILTDAAGDSLTEAWAFPRQRLFDPIGMRTAILEVDTGGSFVSGTNTYASTRDYARLALLYLNDGVWDGERILPPGWVDYVTTPVPDVDPDFPYGGQFWLNHDGVSDTVRHEGVPRDAYFMNGHQGQHVAIIPSLDLVVARNGLSEFDTWDFGDFLRDVVEACRPASAA